MANEKRLIDANALYTKLGKMAREPYYQHDGDDYYVGIADASMEVHCAPTVDAVEVVRCKDCLYRSQYPDESGHYKCGGLLTEDEELLLMVKPDFFCAYGERRGKDAVD